MYAIWIAESWKLWYNWIFNKNNDFTYFLLFKNILFGGDLKLLRILLYFTIHNDDFKLFKLVVWYTILNNILQCLQSDAFL